MYMKMIEKENWNRTGAQWIESGSGRSRLKEEKRGRKRQERRGERGEVAGSWEKEGEKSSRRALKRCGAVGH